MSGWLPMDTKKCCFTGRRNIPSEYFELICHELENEVLKAVKEGYTCFLSGFASGADLMAAETVINLRSKNNNIQLEAYLPYAQRISSKNISSFLDKCDRKIICSDYYFKGCYHKRNRCMVDQCQKIIAITDGKEGGGTGYTIDYARKKNIDVVEIKYGKDNK